MYKKLFILSLFILSLRAQENFDIEIGKYVKNTKQPWNFELYNKSDDTIWFSLYFPGWVRKNTIIAYQEIKSGGKVRLIAKLEENPVIQIWRKEYPTHFAGQKERKPTVERQLKPCVGQHAEFIGIQCRKTAFLTFDNTNVLRPQTGPLHGFSTKTESELNRMNNITQIGIRPVAKAIR